MSICSQFTEKNWQKCSDKSQYDITADYIIRKIITKDIVDYSRCTFNNSCWSKYKAATHNCIAG